MRENNSKSGPRCALVVVTDPAMRQLCSEILGRADFRVTNGIESGAVAIVRTREQRPDIILLSQQLSDVPAREAVKWLRSNRESATTPIIILGGETGSETAPGGKTVVLPRPITAARLHDALIQALAPSRVGNAAFHR
ncbi:MAG TPA: response regulator [Stellaceae bacterium]|nr:response regulator [Stellaceae bacterium]